MTPTIDSSRRPLLSLIQPAPTSPLMPDTDHDDRRAERGEDRIITLLQVMAAAQDRAGAQILAQLGAVQVDLKSLSKADNEGALALARLEGDLKQAQKDAAAAKALADMLKEQVNRWQGWSAAGFGAIALGGLVLAFLKLYH